ncbi:MAG: PQQ-dependent sugar dehydrogenase [Gaiellaceae bacterium]
MVAVAAIAAVPSSAAAQAEEPPAVGLRTVADGLTSPVTLTSPGDGSGRLFVVDQAGLIRLLMPDGTLRPEPFLDLRGRMVTLMPGFDERGLLGLAFHPQYAANGRFFVYYSAPLRAGGPAGFNHTSHISEFRVSADPNRADPASERILLQVDEPQFNHNGGTLLFGPDDGDLYISLGDGGGANDVGLGHVADWFADNGGGNGQDVTENLLGSILRIDVDAGTPYGIPPDNPFAGSPGLDEVWAYGFRNPYRMSFDSGGTHQLFVGDVGQNSWEEVSIVSAGGNYGWNVKEGTHCFDAENPNQEPATCPDVVGAGHPRTGDPLIDPIIEYPQARLGGPGVAVVGGHVYRGSALPQFRGRYLFGDWSRSFGQPNGSLFVAKPRKSGLWNMQELRVATSPTGRLNARLLGFGQDAAGELYVLTTNNTGPTGTTGRVLKLVRPSGG